MDLVGGHRINATLDQIPVENSTALEDASPNLSSTMSQTWVAEF
jgi:hypothetical protein